MRLVRAFEGRVFAIEKLFTVHFHPMFILGQVYARAILEVSIGIDCHREFVKFQQK